MATWLGCRLKNGGPTLRSCASVGKKGHSPMIRNGWRIWSEPARGRFSGCGLPCLRVSRNRMVGLCMDGSIKSARNKKPTGSVNAMLAARAQRRGFNHGSTTVQPTTQPKPNSPISDLRSAISDLQKKESTPPPDARSGRPIFSGRKLTVFEWQLDDCMKTLGTFTDAFDLHEWFFTLDQQAFTANLVIPKRDGGTWLQSQLVAEAQRRGVPLVIASAEPTNKRIAGLVRGGEAFLKATGGT